MRRLYYKVVLVVLISWMFTLGISNSLTNLQTPLSSSAFASTAENQSWEIFDKITPTLDKIEWFEEGVHLGPPSWISDGRWLNAHSRQILVKSGNYIFATFSETFNWTAVNESFEKEGWHIYPSFDDFRSDISNDPASWLQYSWGIPADWLGISANNTRVVIEFIPEVIPEGAAHIEISCSITNIPGYFMETFGRAMEIGIGTKKLPKPMFAGFDLTMIYIGDFEALQFHSDYGPDHGYYRISFKAPANLLSQSIDTYSLSLKVYPPYRDQTHNVKRFINIFMPSHTEVKNTSPGNISTYTGNIATFTLEEGDRYPTSFQVTSGPTVKDFSQVFIESAGRWITEPEAWIAFGALVALIYGAVSSKRLWSRRKTYYRLYRSMVNTYDRYSQDFPQLHKEIESLSKTITQYFIEGLINDDQFDKLLARRDDLIERAKALQEKN